MGMVECSGLSYFGMLVEGGLLGVHPPLIELPTLLERLVPGGNHMHIQAYVYYVLFYA